MEEVRWIHYHRPSDPCVKLTTRRSSRLTVNDLSAASSAVAPHSGLIQSSTSSKQAAPVSGTFSSRGPETQEDACSSPSSDVPRPAPPSARPGPNINTSASPEIQIPAGNPSKRAGGPSAQVSLLLLGAAAQTQRPIHACWEHWTSVQSWKTGQERNVCVCEAEEHQ